ncbi:hypothetical protein BB559_004416 [Furculomyces boomerangus]|uniref:Pre-mRNA-processing factor 17 n=2 Tax=Harpellales TaxID=61421 RepID=A0A2T9YEQ1_9FUNG|nr:hypothetical protein BB559_004416 [Furculomyces boomerangus]PWA00552.1 hypothetical protein BB558_003396 [Smittium angustum]
MSLVLEYSSSEDEISIPTKTKKFKVDSAPDVGIQDIYLREKVYIDPKQTEIAINLPYDQLSQKSLGPLNQFQKKNPNANTITGIAEENIISEHDFREQERSFRSLGYTLNPSELQNSANKYIGNINLAEKINGASPFSSKVKNNSDLKRKPKGDSSVLEGDDSYLGPWAGYHGETKGEKVGPTEEQMLEWNSQKQTSTSKPEQGEEIIENTEEESTVFHGTQERDYQGRTYMEYPRDLNDPSINFSIEPGSQGCFPPKQCVHQFTAHAKGVSAIRFLPKTGHLLLTSGMDGRVKLWDFYHSRSLLRSYIGHTKAVRDITFDNKGSRFLSTSYDKFIKLWDTETGQCISKFTSNKTPYVSRFHPTLQNIFLTGQSDKKIIQWDIRTKGKVQEYNEHMGAVSTITFVEDGRRFISTSDDKTMRAWEFGIPVVVKLIADPSMHSIPAVALHPSKKWIACQSLDNQIMVWNATDKFRQNRKKVFSGHLVSGYACQVSFSPDGKLLTSGDSEGKLWFWDWKSTKVVRKLQAHSSVTIGAEWNPVETSKVATCSWDGTVKYWD